MKVCVTRRALQLIDDHYGLDMYLLQTAELNLRSKLACKLKREILMALALDTYYPNDERAHAYIAQKYADYVMPSDEAEWIGLDLNEACRKLQDIEEMERQTPIPLKVTMENELIMKLANEQRESMAAATTTTKKEVSISDRLLGKVRKQSSTIRSK